MKYPKAIAPMLITAAIAVFGIGLIPNHSSVEFEDRAFTAVGPATLTAVSNGTLSADLAAPEALIAIGVGESPALNVYFEPIEISVGGEWIATARNGSGNEIASIRHAQTGPTTTDLYLNLGETASRLEGDVRLFTHLDGVMTHEASLVPSEEIFLGTVTASTAAWAKTYHLYCTNGECSLATDPDETTLAYAADGVSAPFQYVSVSFTVDDVSLAAAAALEFSGTGMSNMTFNGHDDIPLDIFE